MLHNSHKEGLTWSWEAAQFCHLVLHVTLLLSWGEQYHLSEEHPATRLSQTGAARITLALGEETGSFPDLRMIQDQSPRWSVSGFQRMDPKGYPTHSKQQAGHRHLL